MNHPTDPNHHYIRKYDLDGVLISEYADSKLYYPRGLAFDTNGNLIVANSDQESFLVYDSSFNFINEISVSPLHQPWGVAVKTDGLIYISGGNSQASGTDKNLFFVYDSEYNFIKSFSGTDLTEPAQAAFDENAFLYSSSTNLPAAVIFDSNDSYHGTIELERSSLGVAFERNTGEQFIMPEMLKYPTPNQPASLNPILIGSFQKLIISNYLGDTVKLKFWYGPYSNGAIIGGEYNPPWGPLFDLVLTRENVGDIFTVDSGIPFNIAVECLTNGITDSYALTSQGGPETSLWFADNIPYQKGYYTGQNGIDFEGFIIDRIELRIDSYNETNFGYTILVYGEPDYEPVDIDIKPNSCPNSLNINSKGILTVAILGTADFDITTIDLASVRLEEVAPIRSSTEDCSTPILDPQSFCECNSEGQDGFDDLVLKFRTSDVIDALDEVQGGDIVELTLIGALTDGTSIEGKDCIVFVKKKKKD